ncbi:MAG: NAD-dependent epimerase/dehydratase family protein [Rikenellaceae bacterium]|nr:NAD-dependent epimerase/dehydratase family protein [Rikenellaceae bacterium]MBR2628468.1 NAD-dependent epimerase/dehydratase family protein [Alistipes sp.]
MKVLITGVHGFVGSNLVPILSRNNEIYGLDIIAPKVEGVVETFSWQDLDNNKIPEMDAIIHLAGKAHDTKKQADAAIYFEINTGLTKKIYDYFCKSSAQNFVFFSSVKAAADSVVGDMLFEDVVPQPKGPYGESKIEAEKYIQSQGHPQGKSVYILRPCMIHGPGNKGNLNLLYSVVKKGIPWPLGSFDNLRSFCSVDNLIFIIESLLGKDVESGIYHIADDDPMSTNRLIELICESEQKHARIWHLSPSFVRCCAKCGTFLHLPLNTERLQKLTENYVVSNAKIKKAVGVNELPMRAEDGIMKTLKSFKI